MKLLLLVLAVAVAEDTDDTDSVIAGHWDYNFTGEYGPANWYKQYPLCKLNSQSPIDIESSEAVQGVIFPDFRFHGYNSLPLGARYVAHNNGHSVAVGLHAREDYAYGMAGGGLPTNYYAAQFHFHWGSNNIQGSEHTVDGKAYPLELHIVHFSGKFGDLGKAVPEGRGLAVLGVFFTLGEKNEAFEKVLDCVRNVTYSGEEKACAAFPIWSILPQDLRSFWRYSGSLTTPGCAESVIWTVFKQPVEISQQQMNVFRNVKKTQKSETDKVMVNNYRPVQPLNGRILFSASSGDKAGVPLPPPPPPPPAPVQCPPPIFANQYNSAAGLGVSSVLLLAATLAALSSKF